MVSQLTGRPSVPVQRQGLITHHNPGRHRRASWPWIGAKQSLRTTWRRLHRFAAFPTACRCCCRITLLDSALSRSSEEAKETHRNEPGHALRFLLISSPMGSGRCLCMRQAGESLPSFADRERPALAPMGLTVWRSGAVTSLVSIAHRLSSLRGGLDLPPLRPFFLSCATFAPFPSWKQPVGVDGPAGQDCCQLPRLSTPQPLAIPIAPGHRSGPFAVMGLTHPWNVWSPSL